MRNHKLIWIKCTQQSVGLYHQIRCALTDSWYHQDKQEDDSEGIVYECQGSCCDALSHWICGLYRKLVE